MSLTSFCGGRRLGAEINLDLDDISPGYCEKPYLIHIFMEVVHQMEVLQKKLKGKMLFLLNFFLFTIRRDNFFRTEKTVQDLMNRIPVPARPKCGVRKERPKYGTMLRSSN